MLFFKDHISRLVGCPADLQVWNFIYLHVNSENMGKISDKNQILGQNVDFKSFLGDVKVYRYKTMYEEFSETQF